LAQGDAQAVKTYGDSFENEIRTFTQQYGGVRRLPSSIDMTSAHRVVGRVVSWVGGCGRCYVQEALAGSFLDEAQKLLGRLHHEGDGIIRASRVREEIAKIRQQDDMTRLSMVICRPSIPACAVFFEKNTKTSVTGTQALNVRDGPKISQHGAAFKAQIQRFKQAYANEPAARVFLNESEVRY
jgi:hypothetical protein